VTDRFRLVYLKSTEQENHGPRENLFSSDRERSNRILSTPADPSPESHATREILKQAKEDLKHPDPKVRRLAVKYFLEKSHLSIPMPLLQDILSDPDPTVRSEALSTLIAFGNPIVSPFLKRHLRDPDPTVRLIALRGIFKFKEKIDLNLLIQLLSDDSPWVRRKLATLLGWNQMEGVLPILMEMTRDEHPMVKKAAIFSLVTLYPEEGEVRLMEAMTDSDPDIRKWAKDHLTWRIEKPLTQRGAPLSREY